jgi:hypothetical protein
VYFGFEIDYSITKETVKNNEDFSLIITNHSVYEINGFHLEEVIDKENKGSIEYVFSFDEKSEDFKVDLELFLENRNTYKINVFGFFYNDVLYISTLSKDIAIKNAYKNEYESKSIEEEQYLDALQKLSNEAIGYQKIVNIAGDLKEDVTKSGNTFVNGTLEWEDDVFNINHPLQFVKVEIWDDDSIGDEKIGTTTTDINGNFSFAFNNVTFLENGGQDVYLKIYSKGLDTKVTDGSTVYKVKSDVEYNVATGSTTTIDVVIDMSNDAGKAFQASQALITGNRYVNAMGSSVSDVELVYPSSSSYYTFINEEISLGADDYCDWDIVLHEYGHHIQNIFEFSDSPGGQHASIWNLIVRRGDKDEGTRLAWGEAWPTVFSIQVTYYYASDLSNIDRISDEFYDDTRNQTIHYSLETGASDGEGQERAIMGVLFDMYDGTTGEVFDNIDLSHSSMWNLVTNSGTDTFSEFANHVYNTQSSSISKNFSSLLDEYGMSPTNLSVNGNISSTPATFTWDEGGCSSSSIYENDRFELVFYDETDTEYYRIPSLTTNSYTPSSVEWDDILDHYGNTFYVRVVGYETNSPETGGYMSDKYTFSKNTLETLTKNINFYDTTRYREEIIELYPSQDKEFIITFETAGKKVIQTFGSYNTRLYIYDSFGNTIAYDYSDGYSLNTFYILESDANTTYTIRVCFASSNQNGTFKLGIYPTIFSGITDFEDIANFNMGSSFTLNGTTQLNCSSVFTLSIN